MSSIDGARHLTEADLPPVNGHWRVGLLQDLVAGTCLSLSGFLALTYGICWIRKASTVFGTTTFSLGTVGAVLLGGLALGSYAIGKYTPRTSRPLRLFGSLGIVLGLIALLGPAAFAAADAVYGRVYPLISHNIALLSLTRFVLLTAVLLPPTFLMGGTLPLFCRHFVTTGTRISLLVGLLYGTYTLGAATGCTLCGLLLIPRLGVNQTMHLSGMLNILIGMVVWLLSVNVDRRPTAVTDYLDRLDEHRVLRPSDSRRWSTYVHGLFFLTGFVALGTVVVWMRFLSLLMDNTVYVYTLSMTVILVGIVLGSTFTAELFDRAIRRALIFGAVQIGSGIVILTVLMLPATSWRPWLDAQSLLTQLWIMAQVLMPAAVLLGVSFPLAIRMVVHQPAQAGRGVGRMSAVNTVGGIVAALTTAFFTLPLFGMQMTLLAMTGMSLLIGFTAWMVLERMMTPAARCVLVVLSFSLWLVIPYVSGTRLPADFLAHDGKLVDFREGLSSHLAAVQKVDRLLLKIDRLPNDTDHKSQQAMAVHVPILLHPGPKRLLVIGLGDGQTASRALIHDVEQLDCVEIERRLIPFVKQHFPSAWMSDRRVRFIVKDGRNYLTHTSAKYDLIAIDVGPFFRPGLAPFYTADFYHRARRRLNPNGLLCQQVPISFFSPSEVQTLVRTFLDAFPQSVLWYNARQMLLIGTVAEELKLTGQRLAMLDSNDALHQDLDFAYWGGPAQRLNRPEVFLAGFLSGPAGLARFAQGAPIYRDDRPYLEYTTAKRREKAEIPIVELILGCVEPVQLILDSALDKQMGYDSQWLRERNLRDIVANALIRPVPALRARARHREVIDLLRQAINWNEDNVHIQFELATELMAQGQLDRGIYHYRQVLNIMPDSAETHSNLAKALKSKGKLEEAIQHYRRALQIKPDLAKVQFNLGNALFAQGKLDEATSHYRQALMLEPDFIAARGNLAQTRQMKADQANQP